MLPCNFSSVTKIQNGITDVKSVLENAKSMASSYESVKRQASQGNEAQINVQTWIADGLNSSLVQIKNNDNEEITYDNHGLWARSWDDITEAYLPEQLRITSNILAFTKDNWLTCSAALGKHAYTYYDKPTNSFTDAVDYGLSAQFVQAGYIYGTQIIGGDIYSDNYSPTSGTYINLRDGSFSFAGGKLKYDNNVLSLKGDITANTLNATNSGKISCWNFNNNALYRGMSEWGSEGSFYFGVDGISIGNQFTIDRMGNFSFAGGKLEYDGDTLSMSDNFIIKPDGSIIVHGEIRSHNAIYMNFNKDAYQHWGIEGYHPIILKDDGIGGVSFGIIDEGYYIEFNKLHGIRIYSHEFCILGEEYGQANHLFFCYSSLVCKKDLYVDGTLYTSSGTVSKSDKESKNSISPLSKIDSANFIYSLNPTQYKLNDGTSDRYHHGFIAQEVKEAMGNNDWGVYVDTSINNDSDDNQNEKKYKAIRYEEIIADLVATVQSQNERISLLEEQISKLLEK